MANHCEYLSFHHATLPALGAFALPAKARIEVSDDDEILTLD